MNLKKTISTIFLAGAINIGFSQNDTMDLVDFAEMDLEDLMNLTVESSTKSKISIQEAPSIVRVFTQKDFEARGFYTLKDVLHNVPGLQVQEYVAGHQLVWVRGVQSRYNNKVLLLIDGVPMRDAFYGNFNIDEMIPLESVEKIEILNGPGSVLYGANSFAGVINITTKKEGKSVGVNYGTYNTKAVHAQGSVKGLYAFAKYYHSDGFAPDLYGDGQYKERSQANQNVNLLLKYNYKNFTAIGSYTNYTLPYRFRSANKDEKFTRNPIYGALKYQKDFEKKGAINVTAYYNHFNFLREKNRFLLNDNDEITDDIRSQSTEYLNSSIMGTDVDYTLTKGKHNITTGVSWLHDIGRDIREDVTFYHEKPSKVKVESVLTENPNRHSIGLFAQDFYKLNKYLNITGGVRYDILSHFENQFNYRGGLTSKITDNLYAKALFGTAYRVPMYRESLEAKGPNPNLSPEKLQTTEIQVGYVTSKIDINLTFFNNNYHNFIKELDVVSMDVNGEELEVDDEVSFNFDTRTINGLELNMTLYPIKNLTLYTGASYLLTAEERLGHLRSDVVTHTPQDLDATTSLQSLGNLSGYFHVNYTIKNKFTFGTNSYFVTARNVGSNYQEDVPELSKENLDGFLKQDFYIRYVIIKGLSTDLKIDNAFNSTIFNPAYGKMGSYATQWQGRVFRLGVNYVFN